jgi:hypothetical protein
MLDFSPGIHDATWVSGEILLARSTTATRASSTRPAITPGEPPTLALWAEGAAIIGLYLILRGIWRVRRGPNIGHTRVAPPATRPNSLGEASEVRDRDAA